MDDFNEAFGKEERSQSDVYGGVAGKYAEQVARLISEGEEAARKMFGFAEKGERAPAWLMAPAQEVIEKEASRGMELVASMAPGGYKQKAGLDVAKWRAGARVGAEREMFRFGVEAMTRARDTATRGYSYLTNLYKSMGESERAFGLQREGQWLDLIGDIAGGVGMAMA